VDRRSFLQVAVLGGGLGAAGARIGGDPQAVSTAATSAGVGLGTQRVVWSLAADDDAVALTFDDGPDPDLTPGLLDVLARHDVRATFLVVGERAAQHPDLLRRIRAGGHEVGNHTWSHHSLAELSVEGVRREIGRTAELLGAEARWFRPPRGVLTGAAAQVAAEHGYDILMWSSGAQRPLAAGAIACMHDGLGRAGFSRWSPTVTHMRAKRSRELATLPARIARATSDGLRFVLV
jgi:peptidoglycan/xylan/chitin deacetylase (PgdA/CDA1 family)